MLAGAEDGGPGPSPRSFHAAAYVPAGRGAMYLLGGLTAGGVTRDFWVLNLTTLQWRQEKVTIYAQPYPHARSGRDGPRSSCRFPTKGDSIFQVPTEVPALDFTGHPESRYSPSTVPGQRPVLLCLACLGHSESTNQS